MDDLKYREIYETVSMKPLKVLHPNKRGSSELTPLTGKDIKNSIFLAGPCPRGNDKWDWRDEAINILRDLGFDGSVMNPTNPYFDSIDLAKQTKWEWEAMCKASAIVFWVDRSDEHPAFTTNIELGCWWGKKGVFIGFPKNAPKTDYIQEGSKIRGVPIYNDLRELLTAVVTDLRRPSQNFFTSDTHFGAERTLELSRRPFRDVEDMDLQMISNWNKTVRPNDVVYHLGDFGDFEVLKMLNYNHMHFIMGNYETKDLDSSEKALKKFKDVTTYLNDECQFEGKEHIYTLRHEPLGRGQYEKDAVYLFGHIHGRCAYKRNGIDVGIDTYGGYTPLSQEEVEWRANAALIYVDENVFTDTCK